MNSTLQNDKFCLSYFLLGFREINILLGPNYGFREKKLGATATNIHINTEDIITI